jgi:hypothetical protein
VEDFEQELIEQVAPAAVGPGTRRLSTGKIGTRSLGPQARYGRHGHSGWTAAGASRYVQTLEHPDLINSP